MNQPNAKPIVYTAKWIKENTNCGEYVDASAYEELENSTRKEEIRLRGIHGREVELVMNLLSIIKKLTEMGEFYGDEVNWSTHKFSEISAHKICIDKTDVERFELNNRNQISRRESGGKLARQTLATVADELKKIGVVL